MGVLCFFIIIAMAAIISPDSAKAASIADLFGNCAAISGAPGRILTVDANNHGSSIYPNIAAALIAAAPGDTINLMSGDYGELTVTGMNQNGFVTIAAAPGQTPRFTHISIGGNRPASHWRLTGLTISSMSPPANGKWIHNQLIIVTNSDDIIFDHNNVSSQEKKMMWLPELPGSPITDAPSHGFAARQSWCISVIENRFENLFNNIEFGGDQTGNWGKYALISGNSIDNFAGDGIDHYGSHVRIENNRITNGHDICNNQCIHSDGIQGWNYNHLPVVNSDVTVDGNVIIAQLDPNLVLPVDALQGITIFDGRWDNVRVYNNLIVVDAWHGITFNRVMSGSIVNNTIAPADPARKTWILVNGDKTDPAGTAYNIIVRNNVFPGVIRTNTRLPLGVIMDHNLALRTSDDYSDAFVSFDQDHFTYDLHPTARSPVIGEGSPEGAPTNDIEGHTREFPLDIGAYAYSDFTKKIQ